MARDETPREESRERTPRASGRAMWRAELVVGDERVPVKLYAAAVERGVRLHLLHAKDGARVQQRMAHAETGETVPAADVRRGLELERGLFVVLEDEELAELEPEPSREIRVERFLPAGAIDHRWYQRPYYLGPDGPAGRYWALAGAMEESGREALAFWTLRKREHAGALRLREGRLALIELNHADEVVPASDLVPVEGRALDARERALAKQLIEALAGPFEHAEFADEYRARVMELVESKRRGERIKVRRWHARAASDDSLLKSLEESIRRAS